MVLLGHNELNSLQPENAYTMYVSLHWIIELNDHKLWFIEHQTII